MLADAGLSTGHDRNIDGRGQDRFLLARPMREPCRRALRSNRPLGGRGNRIGSRGLPAARHPLPQAAQ